MVLALQLISCLLWFPLDMLAITAIFRSGVRRYPLIFTYMTVTFLVSAIQIPASFAFHRSRGQGGDWLDFVHYLGEVVTYTLVLAVVISLVYRATARTGPRRIVRLGLVAGGVLF